MALISSSLLPHDQDTFRAELERGEAHQALDTRFQGNAKRLADEVQVLLQEGRVVPDAALIHVALLAWEQDFPALAQKVIDRGRAIVPALNTWIAQVNTGASLNHGHAMRLSYLLCRCAGEVDPALDGYFCEALSAVAAYNDMGILLSTFRDCLRAMPLERRERLVLSEASPIDTRRGVPLLLFTVEAPTERVGRAVLTLLNAQKRGYFDRRADQLAAFQANLDALAREAPNVMMENLAGAAKRSPHREMQLRALIRTLPVGVEDLFLAYVSDSNEGASKAAQDGIAALGERATEALEKAATNKRHKAQAWARGALDARKPG